MAPEVAITQPGASILFSDNDESEEEGFQVTFGGDVTDSKEYPIRRTLVNGVTSATTTVSPDGSFVFDPITLESDGNFEVTAKVQDDCGNEGEAQTSVLLSTAPASFQFTDPAQSTETVVLLAKDDEDPATTTVYESSFQLALSPSFQDTNVIVECRLNEVNSVLLPVGEVTLTSDSTESVTVDVPQNLNWRPLGK